MRRIVLVLVVGVVVAAVAFAFYLVGPPAEERARRLDERRTSDLRRLQLAIDLYWTRNGRLPATLNELASEAGTDIYARDPESGELYDYGVKRSGVYELCASFARPSGEPGGFWSHGAGTRCFEIDARRIRAR